VGVPGNVLGKRIRRIFPLGSRDLRRRKIGVFHGLIEASLRFMFGVSEASNQFGEHGASLIAHRQSLPSEASLLCAAPYTKCDSDPSPALPALIPDALFPLHIMQRTVTAIREFRDDGEKGAEESGYHLSLNIPAFNEQFGMRQNSGVVVTVDAERRLEASVRRGLLFNVLQNGARKIRIAEHR
jgi:hypothetical protein